MFKPFLLEVQGPEFNPQDTEKMLDMVDYICNPRAGELETGNTRGLLHSQPSLINEARSVKDLVSKKMDTILEDGTKVVLLPPYAAIQTGISTHTCTLHTKMHTHSHTCTHKCAHEAAFCFLSALIPQRTRM